MKIALLNLQYDNNYGGNLQRYALMSILERMGHDVTHLNLRFNYDPAPWYSKCYRTTKRVLKRILGRNVLIFPERKRQKEYERLCSVTDCFYNRYIKHTAIIGHKYKLTKQGRYDAYIVGSDQVWRKTIASIYGIDTFFLDFVPETCKVKRIAYGVSLGTSSNELNEDDLKRLTPLYQLFDAVSVREDSALTLFDRYGWKYPQAMHVLDPTLLLEQSDYMELIYDGSTIESIGNMFCYILDPSKEKEEIIKDYERNLGLTSFEIGLGDKMGIQQWLRSFYDSEFIVTDSYHGVVFSIIFNKPFKFISNAFRGNARIESLISSLSISLDNEEFDWDAINDRIKKLKNQSILFLEDSLQCV